MSLSGLHLAVALRVGGPQHDQPLRAAARPELPNVRAHSLQLLLPAPADRVVRACTLDRHTSRPCLLASSARRLQAMAAVHVLTTMYTFHHTHPSEQSGRSANRRYLASVRHTWLAAMKSGSKMPGSGTRSRM